MKKITISLVKDYDEVKESILDQMPYPEEFKQVKEKLEELLPTKEFLELEELLGEGLLKIDGSRYDMGYNVKKALENGIDKIVIEV